LNDQAKNLKLNNNSESPLRNLNIKIAINQELRNKAGSTKLNKNVLE